MGGERRTGFVKDLGIADFDEQIVTCLEGDLLFGQLLGHEVVPIEADRDGKRRIAADANRVANAELRILDEEVIVVDPAAAPGNLAFAVGVALGSVGNERRGFFLNLDDAIRVCLLIRFSDSFSAVFEPEALAERSPFWS